jgi:O-antigen biosynthesis protein
MRRQSGSTLPFIIRRDRIRIGLGTIVIVICLVSNLYLISLLDGASCIFVNNPGCKRIEREGHRSVDPQPETSTPPPLLTLLVVTSKNPESLGSLFHSIATQTTEFQVEVIVADHECLEETQKLVNATLHQLYFSDDKQKSITYAPLCNSPESSVVGWANPKSKWLLFLDDALTLQPTFLQSMMNMGQSRRVAGAVGCMIMNDKGDEVIEAGGVLWSDGSSAGYGRGRSDFDAPDLAYARPVDYVSEACLMVRSKLFVDNGGFRHELFPNYYADIDFQLRLQHDLGREVWFQPLAKANKHDPNSSESEIEESKRLSAAKVLREKWLDILEWGHALAPKQRETLPILLERNRDTRFRNSSLSKILYIDERLPNPARGSSSRRAYDNLRMLSDLGHYITVTVLSDPNDWCDQDCRQNLETKLAVEVMQPMHGSLGTLMMRRLGFYDIVMVAGSGTLDLVYSVLQKLYKYAPFVLVYDTAPLSFRRDELLLDASTILNFSAHPGGISANATLPANVTEKAISFVRDWELGFMAMADIIVTGSNQDTRLLHEINACGQDGGEKIGTNACKLTTSVHSVARILESNVKAHQGTLFEDRHGILFVGSFNGKMYGDGHAIWDFLKTVFPLILKEARGAIPLTILGKDIPNTLREFVETNAVLGKLVTILESPSDIRAVYNQHRLVLAPHLYGAGMESEVCTENKVLG